MIPMMCRICFYCLREIEKCGFDREDKCTEDCEEFKFEPLYLIDILEELEKRGK